ncbi:bifunctional alanine racemase/tRNA (adenosine(37)-N6)-threonylcarbamoyltransferase complex ATPase subunit type 1 TsaE [Kocuria marina]|nr:bifunctional alanine racemase/tRNA (adenosine(37)-N6)-threonylcarbamoyltransferase complex ATPase subunit type 1 TsaE [Kocuria marina]
MTSRQPRQPSERSAVVDLSAVQHNVRRLAELARGRRLIAVVKADAYGHGAVPVARAALAAGAHMLGTAHASEAVTLRDAGTTAPVLAWLHTPATDFEQALRRDIRLGLNGWELDAVLTAARATGTPATVHLKIDSGLGRNGATVEEWPGFVERVVVAQNAGLLRVEGIFTHLAVADEPQREAETVAQLHALSDAVRIARDAGLEPTLIHAANTPGLLGAQDMADPDLVLRDAVRVGLGLYGLSPFADRTPEDFGLRPAMTLRTRVANVKAVPAGHGVSYGFAYRTAGPTHLALIPLGYADGVPRVATGAPVRIGDRVYPVVGRIAMDQCVVDLSLDGEPAASSSGVDSSGAEPAVRVGDKAVLFGAGEDPSVTRWADAAGTINYEIVTRISPRVPREYVNAPDADGAGTAGSAADGAVWTLTRHPDTAHDTRVLAERVAEHLRAGDLVMLNGDLGAGKTTFTQGLGRGLGVRDGIISPTFVLSRVHPNDPDGPHPGGPDLVHVDAYRLDSAADVDDIDLEDTVDTCVTVVEWGTGKVEHLSDSRLVIDIVRARGTQDGPGSTDPVSDATGAESTVGTTDGEDPADLSGAVLSGGSGSDGEGDSPSAADVIRALNDEWKSAEQLSDEPRAVIVRGYGPRWADPLQL